MRLSAIAVVLISSCQPGADGGFATSVGLQGAMKSVRNSSAWRGSRRRTSGQLTICASASAERLISRGGGDLTIPKKIKNPG